MLDALCVEVSTFGEKLMVLIITGAFGNLLRKIAKISTLLFVSLSISGRFVSHYVYIPSTAIMALKQIWKETRDSVLVKRKIINLQCTE